MSNANGSVSINIGFWGLLTLIFITLKLCSVITWSWWWVLALCWIPIAVIIVVGLAVFIIALINTSTKFTTKK